jgi:hypothetical protein
VHCPGGRRRREIRRLAELRRYSRQRHPHRHAGQREAIDDPLPRVVDDGGGSTGAGGEPVDDEPEPLPSMTGPARTGASGRRSRTRAGGEETKAA